MKVPALALKKSRVPVALAILASLAMPAFAVDTVDPVDITLITAGIAALKVAVLAIIGTLIAYYSSMFAVSKVMSFIKKKSGVS